MRARIEAWFQTLWRARGFWAVCLWPLSWCYGQIWRQRASQAESSHDAAAASVALSRPLWVVGNLVVGGAGKTPVTLALIESLKALDVKVGVISRGYGRSSTGPMSVTETSTASEVGDEPLLIARRSGVPVLVAEDRKLAFEALLKAQPELDLVISDDGLQNLSFPRTRQWVVLDERGLGNGWLLPAGPLREPPSGITVMGSQAYLRGIRTGFIYNADRQTAPWAGPLLARSLALPIPWAQWKAEPDAAMEPNDRAWQDWWARTASHRRDSTELSPELGPVFAAAAGIALPERFFSMLQTLHAPTDLMCIAMADHAPTAHWQDMKLSASVRHLIVTEKDAVKLSGQWAQDRALELWVARLITSVPQDDVRAALALDIPRFRETIKD